MQAAERGGGEKAFFYGICLPYSRKRAIGMLQYYKNL